MNRSQSWRSLANGDSSMADGMSRATSQQYLAAGGSVSPRTNTSDLRRRIVQLNKELEEERIYSKQVKRDRSVDVRQAREDEQRKANVLLSELRSKMHREKVNEVASVKEQMHRDKEKEIAQILRQKEEAFRFAQHGWSKERDELRQKIRSELWSEAREEAAKEFDKERTRLEQEIADLRYQKKELEESLKIVQEADKRKADEFRRIHYEHESEMDKFKKNSWQESRRQMAEIRQLLNIIEQLEKKLGMEAGQTMRLRMEKDNLYQELRKTQTFDNWNKRMSAPFKGDEDSKTAASSNQDSRQGSQDLRNLQRKNIELSSLVKKLDEKNQQLATKNAELAVALERLEKENKDRNKKSDRKQAELAQNNHRLEARNKMLLDEVNLLKKKPMSGSSSKIPRARGPGDAEDDANRLRGQLREQTRTIADLKQSLMDKDRRIELLKERKKNKSRKPAHSFQAADSLSPPDDDAMSVNSDVSDVSEQSEPGDFDSKRIKKLTKELLALERAYALLQAQTGNIVDAEREELGREQLQSDLIESQARIDELERMLSGADQDKTGDTLHDLQMDNKGLYRKLVQTEKERDEYQAELAKHEENLSELRDQRDLLEFELEEMSQLSQSAFGSEDGDARRSLVASEQTDLGESPLSFEEIKSCLEQIENEKASLLSLKDRRALQEARAMLDSLAQRTKHQDITEATLRNKIRDLEEGNDVDGGKHIQRRRSSDVFDSETETNNAGTDSDGLALKQKEYYPDTIQPSNEERHTNAATDNFCMTDLTRRDVQEMEDIYLQYHEKLPYIEQWIAQSHVDRTEAQTMTDLFWVEDAGMGPDGATGAGRKRGDVATNDGECMTDLVWQELVDLENTYREYLEEMLEEKGGREPDGVVEKFEFESMTDPDANKLQRQEDGESRGKEFVDRSVETNLTTADISYFEEVEAAHSDCILNQKTGEQKWDRHNDGFVAGLSETSDKGIVTDLTTPDLEYLEEVEAVHQNCLENQVATASKVVGTELGLADLQYFEELREEHQESMIHSAKDNKETATDLTMPDLQYFEEVYDVHQECCVGQREEEEKSAAQKDDKGTTTELTLPDLQYYEEVDEVHQDCLVRQSEDESRTSREMHDEGMTTELTLPDLQYFEEVNQLHQECLARQEEHSVNSFVEKDHKGIGTELTLPDLEYLEEVENVHLGCLEKEASAVGVEHRGTTTELGLVDLERLDEVEAIRAELEETRKTRWDRDAAQTEVGRGTKGTMTEMTSMVLSYLEDLQDLYKQKVEECEELRLSVARDVTMDVNRAELDKVKPDLFDQETLTELTLVGLRDLEDIAEARSNVQKKGFAERVIEEEIQGETMDSLRAELDTFPEFEVDATSLDFSGSESEYVQDNLGLEVKDRESAKVQTNEIGTATVLSQDDLFDLEQEIDMLRRKPAGSPKGTMTELTREDLECFEELDDLHKAEGLGRDLPNMENAFAMTEMTTADLEYLEEAEGVYRSLSENADLTKLLEGNRASESKGVATDIAGSDMDYLLVLGEMYKDQSDGVMSRSTGRTLQGEKSTETDLSLLDIRDLEDAAIEALRNPGEAEKDVHLEEALDLHSELRELVDFDEPTGDESKLAQQDQNIMTDLTWSDMEHFKVMSRTGLLGSSFDESEASADQSDCSYHEAHDASVQCDLQGVLTLMQELHQEAEGPGADMPAWYVSALNMTRQDTGFGPVHVVLRNKNGGGLETVKDRDRPGLDRRHSSTLSVQLARPLVTRARAKEAQPDAPGLPDSAPPGQGPDLENDVMSLTDNCSDDVTNTEPRPRGESAVDKFDRFLKDRKESELQLRLDLIGSGESAELDDAIDGGGRPGEDSVGKFDRFLKKREESELGALLELEGKLENGEGGGQEAKHDRSVEELEIENELLKEKILEMEEAMSTVGPDDEIELLQLKLEQLEEAETTIGSLTESNMALLERISQFQVDEAGVLEAVSSPKSTRDNWSEMDPSSTFSKSAEELEIENELLKEKILEMEEAMSTVGPDDEIELLQLKLEQLKEAETTIGSLTESNMALLERISQFQVDEAGVLEAVSSPKSTRDNWSEMDPSSTLSKARLVLVSRLAGLTPSEVDDLQAPTISHASTPLWSPRVTGDEGVQVAPAVPTVTDQRIQTDDDDAHHAEVRGNEDSQRESRDNWSEMDPSLALSKARLVLVSRVAGLTPSEVDDLQAPTISHASTPLWSPRVTGDEADREVQATSAVTSQQSQTADHVTPRSDEGVQVTPPVPCVSSQEIQTTDDLLKLLQLSNDGEVPDHIAKELEKLKQDKRELYDELMELRRTAQLADEQGAPKKLSHESTQTEDALSPVDFPWPTYASSPGPLPVEEYVISEVTSEVESEPVELESLLRGVGPDRPRFELEDVDEESERWMRDVSFKPQERHVISCDMITEGEPEPEITSSRISEDSSSEIGGRLQSLQSMPDEFDEMPDSARSRTDTAISADLDFDESETLPPPPDSCPPPLPSEPPPDVAGEFSSPSLDHELEALLSADSSPPRGAAALRASSRQRSHPEHMRTVEEEVDDVLAEDSIKPAGASLTEAAPVAEDLVSVEGNSFQYGSPPMPGVDTSFWRLPGLRSDGTLERDESRPVSLPLKTPPPTFPKPARTRPPQSSSSPQNPLSMTSPARLSARDETDGTVLPPRGMVRARANSLNQNEVSVLNDKIGFLEQQLKNKENALRSVKVEATDLDTKSLLERRKRELQILEDDVAFLKRENQKKERELLAKIGEINKKNYEVEQWKTEANNSERQRERMEKAQTNLQEQLRKLKGADIKVGQLQNKCSGLEKTNWELNEKVKKLEKTEKEFNKLEDNIQILQNHLQDMESVEKDRDALMEKLKQTQEQRDDLLNKGRLVEAERNDFLRNNKIMEMQRDELEEKYQVLLETNIELKAKLSDIESDLKESKTKEHDSQHERNFAQAQLSKLETNRDALQQRLALVTQERNSLVNRVAELEDLNREYSRLEEGIQTLRLKAAELTREKDEAEMQIPSLKAKISLLKRICKEKDVRIEDLTGEIRDLRNSIANSAMDDLSKIKSNGYSPDVLVKMSGKNGRRGKSRREPVLDNDINNNQGVDVSKIKGSVPGSSEAQLFVVLFDYDPSKSCTTGHPERELKLKEGEYLTVFGDMDTNGCYEAELNGVRGLVPSLYVEEVEDDNESLKDEVIKPKSRQSPSRKRSPKMEIGPHSHAKSDSLSSGSSSTTARSSRGSEPARQCFVALCDYSPYQSCTTGRPELELSLKEGDILTVRGEVDTNGFYRAEMDGRAGLVPAHVVEEVSTSSYLHSSRSTAPEQILGMLDNIKLPQRDFTPRSRTQPPAHALVNGNVNGGVIRPNHVPQANQSTPAPQFRSALEAPPQQLVPSVPLSSPAVSQQSVPVMTSHQPVTSLNALAVSWPRSRPNGPPEPSGRFRALRPVNEDSVLLGWSLPGMDELGRSNGVVVRGYRIRTDGGYKMNVSSPYMAKALVEGLDLRSPIQFSIQTVAEDGSTSEPVTATFADTVNSARSPVYRAEDFGDEDYRTFVALFDYDPFKSSPNQNPACELRFREGDILRVQDTSRKDGFFLGQFKGKKGLIPSNFVEEVAVASSRRSKSRNQRSPAKTARASPMSTRSSPSPRSARAPVSAEPLRAPRKKIMTALYDYNPEEQSPQDNPDSELAFKKGQIIRILGDMNADGFYQAELGGHVGLVPASFLAEIAQESDSGVESGGRRLLADRKNKLRRKPDAQDETV